MGDTKSGTPPGEPALVTVSWVARVLGCSTRHVLRLQDAGLIPPPLKLGRLSRWDRKAIEQWIADGCPPVRRADG